MSDNLLSYYEQELAFFRRQSKQFAQAHPGAAKSLGLSGESVDDPNIARLIESVAFLNARLQKRLDDRYPELTDNLLGLLFPHFLKPIPSYGIVSIEQKEIASSKQSIPANIHFEIESEGHELCIFRTCAETTIYPFKLNNVEVKSAPFDYAKPRQAENAQYVIEIELLTNEDASFDQLSIDKIEFFLKGDSQFSLRLYDLIFDESLATVISSDNPENGFILAKDAVKGQGFDGGFDILPYTKKTFGAHKLLNEFFNFPDKFNFITVDLCNKAKYISGNKLKLFVFLKDAPVDIVRSLSKENIILNCMPIVNLFDTEADPISIEQKKQSNQVVADASSKSKQIYSINKVMDATDLESVEIPLLYCEKYYTKTTPLRWYVESQWNEKGELITEITIIDNSNQVLLQDGRVLGLSVTCSNGNYINSIPSYAELNCRDSISVSGKAIFIKKPAPQAMPLGGFDSSWKLLTHLHLNYNSLLGNEKPLESVKKFFSLYNHTESKKNTAYIESLKNIESIRTVAPIRIDNKNCVVQGTRVIVTIDHKIVSGGLHLFIKFLDYFFAWFCGFNSFTQLVVRLEGVPGNYYVCPRRNGCKAVL